MKQHQPRIFKNQSPKPIRDDFLTEIVSQFILRRKQLGLTQDDIDVLMGNADRQCSKWECGLRTPNSFNLFCWAKALEGRLVLLENHENNS